LGGLVAVAIATAVVVRLRRRAGSTAPTLVVRDVDTMAKAAAVDADSAGDPQEVTSSPVTKYEDFTRFEMQEATDSGPAAVPMPPVTRPPSLKNPFAAWLSNRSVTLSSRRGQRASSSAPPAPEKTQQAEIPTTLDDFIAAAERGDDNFITTVLAVSPFLARAVRSDGITAAHVAARAGHAATLTLLLDSGADVTAADVRGLTILHQAVLAKSLAVSRAALSRGAPLQVRDSAGKTPYEVALLVKAADVAELLLEAAREVASSSPKVLADPMTSVDVAAPSTPTPSASIMQTPVRLSTD
jgi:hypothetical protein